MVLSSVVKVGAKYALNTSDISIGSFARVSITMADVLCELAKDSLVFSNLAGDPALPFLFSKRMEKGFDFQYQNELLFL